MKTAPLGGTIGRTGYPGCGIIAGNSADGENAVLACFIMGRSPLSKNRIFVEDGGGVKIAPFRPELMRDAANLIYSPVCGFENKIILSNGSQTDAIYDSLLAGSSFEEALRTRSFIPDAPNFTPRISALVSMDGHDFRIQMSVVKAMDAYGMSTGHFTFNYESVAPGVGYYLHTYEMDANPLPSFTGEPIQIAITGSIFDTVADIWENMSAENKVSLWVRTIDLSTGKGISRIINKNR